MLDNAGGTTNCFAGPRVKDSVFPAGVCSLFDERVGNFGRKGGRDGAGNRFTLLRVAGGVRVGVFKLDQLISFLEKYLNLIILRDRYGCAGGVGVVAGQFAQLDCPKIAALFK